MPEGREPDDATVSLPSSGAAQRAGIPPMFGEGDVLAGRFRIARFLGRGGFGEVFEAEDLELRVNVALKTVRPDVALDPYALARFRQEIQLARRVTHPNVCRIFDLFHHRSASGNISFLTMELLAGRTLAEHLRERGRMSPDDALPIVRQMASALSAAHEAGVIHRDLKTSNVILAPHSGEGVRTVVTDFGLACGSGGAAGNTAASAALPGIVGTPAYMAPEQLEGREATAATDVYALGVVMYEMITGEQPFSGDTPLAGALKRLQEPPRSPRRLVPTLDASWERAILRCLQRDPAQRFAGALEVVDALAGAHPMPAAAPARRGLLWAAAALALIALTVGYSVWMARRAGPQPGVLRIAPRRAIAVLGLRNTSGRSDAAWLSTALSEMLSTELAAGEKLRAVSGESVARTRIELALAESDSFGRETLARIRKNLAADLVLAGSYLVLGDNPQAQIRLDLRLQDAAAGETIAVIAETGAQRDLFDLVARAGGRLREKLGVSGLAAAQGGAARAAIPVDPRAARLYAEGIDRLRRFDALGARDLLASAVKADPQHALARSALAAAWSALGYDGKARGEARRAADLANALPREERLAVEARYWESSKDWAKAAETYRVLLRFFPDELEYGLRLCAALTSGGKGKEALESLETLRKLSPPLADDPRIDLQEAITANALSDFRRQQLAASRAAAKAATRGAQALLVKARIEEARAWWEMGDAKRSLAASDESRQIASRIGDRLGVATSLGNSANVLGSLKDLAGSGKYQEQALAIYREIGNQRGVASCLNNLAINAKDRGDVESAKKLQMESLAIRREIGDRNGEAVALNNLGTTFIQEGNLVAARKIFEESLVLSREIGDRRNTVRAMTNLAIALKDMGEPAAARPLLEESLKIRREIGDRRGTALNLFNIALVLELEGELAAAKTNYAEALAINREAGDQRGIAYALYGLGEIAMQQGELAEARRLFEEALAVRERRGERATAAETRLALARLAVEQGRHGEAEPLARAAAEEFAREKAAFAAAQGHVVLARSLLARGRARDAREQIGRAARLLASNTNLYARLAFEIEKARVDAAAGRAAEAARALESAAAQAAKAKAAGYEMQARLALAEAEQRAGRASTARLASLEADAAAKGYALIAAKAAALRNGRTK